MPYVASRPIRVKRGNSYVMLKPNDPVPEAEHWHNPKAWEDHGWIRWNGLPAPVGKTPREMAESPVETPEPVEAESAGPAPKKRGRPRKSA